MGLDAHLTLLLLDMIADQ